MFERLVRLEAAISAAESAVYWARIGSSYSRSAGGPTAAQLGLLADLKALRAELIIAAGVPVDMAEEAVMEASYRSSI